MSITYSRILSNEINVLNYAFISQVTLSFRCWTPRLALMLQVCSHLRRCCFRTHSPSPTTTFALAYALLVAWGHCALGGVLSSEAQSVAEEPHICLKWQAGTVF